MSYTPPNYAPPQPLAAGVHTCVLNSFREAPPSKDGKYAAAFVATYQEVESGSEIVDFISFGKPGNPKGDYWSGLRIERLFAIMGLPEPVPGQPLDITALLLAADGVQFEVELVQNGSYLNIQDVRAISTSLGTGTDDIAF